MLAAAVINRAGDRYSSGNEVIRIANASMKNIGTVIRIDMAMPLNK
jgi:hypothetical protein